MYVYVLFCCDYVFFFLYVTSDPNAVLTFVILYTKALS